MLIYQRYWDIKVNLFSESVNKKTIRINFWYEKMHPVKLEELFVEGSSARQHNVTSFWAEFLAV